VSIRQSLYCISLKRSIADLLTVRSWLWFGKCLEVFFLNAYATMTRRTVFKDINLKFIGVVQALSPWYYLQWAAGRKAKKKKTLNFICIYVHRCNTRGRSLICCNAITNIKESSKIVMSMQFWKDFSFPSPIDDILKQGDFDLEELLDEDEVIQETRNHKKELIE